MESWQGNLALIETKSPEFKTSNFCWFFRATRGSS